MYRFNGFTQKANNALNLAIQSAEDLGHTYIGSEHILLGLLRKKAAWPPPSSDLGLTADALEELMKQKIGSGMNSHLSTDDFTPRTKRILQIAVMEAARMGHNYVGTEHLLLAIAGGIGQLRRLLPAGAGRQARGCSGKDRRGHQHSG